MNRDEARFLLSAVRTDRVDRNDPRVNEALRLVEEDPELRSWFEASGRFDQVVAARLAEVTPPPDLRDSILAGLQVSRRPWWPQRSLVLLAAAAVLGFAVFLTSQIGPGSGAAPHAHSGSRGGSFAEFEGDMLDALASLDALDHHSADSGEILAFLRERGVEEVPTLSGGDLLRGEGAGTFVGCKVLEWRGFRASLICLRRSGEGMPDLHLVTVPAEAVIDLGRDEIVAHLPDAEGSPRRWSTAMWRSGDLVHLVVADGRHPDPRRLVPLG